VVKNAALQNAGLENLRTHAHGMGAKYILSILA